jgi:hypothetical protein
MNLKPRLFCGERRGVRARLEFHMEFLKQCGELRASRRFDAETLVNARMFFRGDASQSHGIQESANKK